VTDREGGYRYQQTHPETGDPWPPIPDRLLSVWPEVTGERIAPNLLLINYYDSDARLGLHQGRGDSSLDAPVVSISLGDDATFVLGGLSRKDPVQRVRLASGDLVWFGVRAGTSSLLKRAGCAQDGRINLTLRRVDKTHT
jgi:DNA oxidative demethylase